jgi:cytoskeletal protein CcmA (bactofilin family)
MVFKSKRKNPLGKTVENFETIIGKSIHIDGNLNISQGVRIDGILNGNIFQDEGKTATVAISESGRVNGNIHAQQVIVSGHVKGNIYSLDRVELLATSRIEGEITYGSLGIEVGAKVLGKLNQINTQDGDNVVDLLISQIERKK